MRPITHLLCPVDFSDSSRFALRTAAIIAGHLGAHLTVVTVDDPLLAQVAAQVTPSLTGATERELQRFATAAMTDVAAPPPERTHLIVAVGQPAPLILQSARDAGATLIVMSSQGRSGARKMFFGSTAERVLRDTTVPVLITRGDGSSGSAATALDQSGPVVVPVDLGDGSPEHVGVASAVAMALAAPLVLMHVLEPVFVQEAIALAFGLDEVRRLYGSRTARRSGGRYSGDDLRGDAAGRRAARRGDCQGGRRPAGTVDRGRPPSRWCTWIAAGIRHLPRPVSLSRHRTGTAAGARGGIDLRAAMPRFAHARPARCSRCEYR